MVDLKRLLSTEKFLPLYAKRKSLSASYLPPVAVELHWTSDCNYDCVHCSYGSRRQNKGRLSSECIQSVINDLVEMNVSAVYLSGGGEPTVVKGWDRYAQELLESGIEVALITNGVALSSAQTEVLARMNYIAVSVYSTDVNEYQKITDSRFFDKQWSAPNLIKSAAGKVVVGARCVINKINYNNIVEIYRKAQAAGYDYIIFIPAVDYEGRGVDLNGEEQEKVRLLIAENKSLFDPQFTNALDILNRDVNHYKKTDYTLEFHDVLCGCSAIKVRANAFVNYCGGVWLCQPHIGNPIYQIGNVNDKRFSEIWNSPRHFEIIALLNEEFSKGHCRNCRSIAFNRAADIFEHEQIQFDINFHDPFI